MRRSLALATCFLLFSACDQAAPGPPDTAQASADAAASPSVALVRTATAPYRRVAQAEAAGYEASSPCVNLTVDGIEVAAMGVHYLNEGLLFDGVVDPAAPEILLYEPTASGGLRLVAAEFMVAADAWEGDAPPTFDGVAFDAHLTDDVQHGIPFPHYDLHVWAWERNPDGLFSAFNPQVSCAAAS